MALDPGPLGQLVAEFMEDIERDYGEDAELQDAVICIEVRSIDEDDEPLSTVESRSLEERNTVAIGILTRILNSMVHQTIEEED